MGITKMESRYISARDKIIDYVLYYARQFKLQGTEKDFEKFNFLCMILESCFDCQVINEKPKIITVIYEHSNPHKAHAIDYVY